ncbi:MAG: GNAT family protein [Bacteroidota bacterium]
MTNYTHPVVLEGDRVRLELLSINHLEALCQVGLDPVLWEKAPAPLQSEKDMRKYIHTALEWHVLGTALPFVIIDKPSAAVIGSTRYANIDQSNRRLEIGWTWVGKAWQRTHVNTEAKFLLLRHAFEQLGCIRVEFKTDSLNSQSRSALIRIGAKEEGTLRNHMIVHDGRYRHSVYFSIIEPEWPDVKQRLSSLLARTQRPHGV